MDTIRILFPSALTIAFLGAIESLLSAVVADGMARTRHEPDSELFALGLANFLTPFFGGIPATGAIARTASNFRFGGRTPLAAVTHALTVLLAVILLAPLLSYLPMASMSALLLLVAWNMSEVEHFFHTIRVAPRSDTLVLLICFFLTVAFDMVIAVAVGVLLGALFFIRRMASLTEGSFLDHSHSKAMRYRLPKDVGLYAINGPLFFGAAERAIGALRSIGKDVKVIIFLLDDVVAADMTGLVAMEGVLDELKVHGIKAILVGVNKNVRDLFFRGGIKPMEGVIAYADHIEEAMEIVGGKLERYKRNFDRGPVRLQPLHRQRSGESRPH
jgi:SulP family sulfate permease